MKTPGVEGEFERAAADLAAGRQREAELRLRRVLSHREDHAPSLHLLGLIAHRTGHSAAGADLLRKAAALAPAEPEYHNHLGLVLLATGELDSAIVEFHRVIELEPQFPDARNSIGAALKRQGQVDQAIVWYREALRLRPDFPEALNNLGTALQEQGKLDEALTCYRGAVAARPDYAEALSNLANALRLKEQPLEAIETLQRAAAIRPDLPEIQYNLGLALHSNRQFDEAIAAYRRALALRPNYPEALNNLGNVLEETPQFEQAIPVYREALKLRPDIPETHNNLGTVLKQTGQFDEAIAEYRKSLELRPDFVEAHSNLGNALREIGSLEEAEAEFRKALAIQPDYTEAAWNLGLLSLLRGDFEAGWKAYELRNLVKQYATENAGPAGSQPLRSDLTFWDGQPAQPGEDRRILLLGEQGLGDTIQFIRYVLLMASRGLRVLVYAQPRLKNLLAGQLGIEQVVAVGEPLPSFDVCCRLMSLPHIFSTRLDSIPANIPYLRADAKRVAEFAGKIKEMEQSPLSASPRPGVWASRPLRVGLVWAGNPTYRNDRNRSVHLSMLSPLLTIPGVTFFSLQKGPPGEQLHDPSFGNVIDWTSGLTDLVDTAALISNLDLVISVDTAVAHLAGALGKPVWMLLPLIPDWRWMMDRSDSPWYPTMRLFRQPRRGDWQTPVNQMESELRNAPLSERR